jgi:hypothetical protein
MPTIIPVNFRRWFGITVHQIHSGVTPAATTYLATSSRAKSDVWGNAIPSGHKREVEPEPALWKWADDCPRCSDPYVAPTAHCQTCADTGQVIVL